MKIHRCFKIIGIALLPVFSIISCVHDNAYDLPPIICQDAFPTTNSTVAVAYNLGKTAPLPSDVIGSDMIFEAYVVSSDEQGNFFKSISFQDKVSNPDYGFQMEIDRSTLYIDFPIGSKVRINAKGLVLQKSNGVLKLGPYDALYGVGRISPQNINKHLARSCANNIGVNAQIVPLVFTNLTDAFKLQNINKLMTIKNVQFVEGDLGKKFTDASATSGSNRTLTDNTGVEKIIRNSVFSSFAQTAISPNYQGSGDVTLVLSNYNGDYQGYIRSLEDLNLNNTRFSIADVSPPIGGTNMTYYTPLNENFETYPTTGNFMTPNYVNDPHLGNRYWRVYSFSNNKYIQISGNASTEALQTYFVMPINWTTASNISFKTKDGYNNGSVLKVYYSLNYVPGQNMTAATLVDITSYFSIATGTTTGYATNFTNSGIWNIPANLVGNGYLVFEYKGGLGGATTTMQIDDVAIQ